MQNLKGDKNRRLFGSGDSSGLRLLLVNVQITIYLDECFGARGGNNQDSNRKAGS